MSEKTPEEQKRDLFYDPDTDLNFEEDDVTDDVTDDDLDD